MDSQRFNERTAPDLNPKTSQRYTERIVEATQVPNKMTAPIQDSRFPGYAAVMEDGRLVTDYRTHCAQNFNPKYGNSVRQWMQTNAEGIRQVTRKRQMDSLGGAFFSSSYVPPGADVQKCTEYKCTMMPTNDRKGIGLVRNERVPPLFGTYDPTTWAPAETNTALTTVFEGGRNTPRGREFNVLGDRPVHGNDGKRGVPG
jgi:hypothetical protein